MRGLNADTATKIRALKENLYFEYLDDAILQSMVDCTLLREFERGETLFWEGDPCAGLHIV